jgi:protein-L-isoaspartate(D-aspartate) O-methyltransferase
MQCSIAENAISRRTIESVMLKDIGSSIDFSGGRGSCRAADMMAQEELRPPTTKCHSFHRKSSRLSTTLTPAIWLALLLSIYFNALLDAQESTSEAVYAERRIKLIENVLKPGGIRDSAVLEASLNTRRHEFVPENVREQAYLDRALPIGEHQTISSPFIVALMTEILQPKKTDKVLEIGTGSGYQAAMLSPLVQHVYSIEIIEELQNRTTELLKRLGYTNITTKTGDGYLGWAEHAPFDKIIVTCSPDKIPKPLIEQLADGGLMVIPVGERYQQMLRRYRKVGKELVIEYARPTQFVPMLGVAESQRRDKVDGSRPQIVNGDFEEPASGDFVPGWYYEFGIKLISDPTAPRGGKVARFTSDKPSQPSMLLQVLPLDGEQVRRVSLSGSVKTENVRLSSNWDEQPFIVLQFLDENRNHIGYQWLGPFVGDTPWKSVQREVPIPRECREAIVMIGLFGAVGQASFDGLEIEVLPNKP